MWTPNNPLIYRGVRSTLSRGGFWGWMLGLGLFLVFVLFCIIINATSDELYNPTQPSLSETVGYRFGWFCLGVEIFVAIVVSIWVMADCVVQERKQNTFEFLETLPLSPSRKALGLLIGRNMGLLAVMCVTGLVGTIAALIGGVELSRLLWFHVIVLTGFASSGFLGLAVSIGLGRVSLGGLFVIVFLVMSLWISGALMGTKTALLPLLPIAPLASLSWTMLPAHRLPLLIQENACHFYSLPVPWQLSPVVLYVFLAVVFFLASRRGLTRPEAPCSPRWNSLIVLGLFHGLLIGFIADFLKENGAERYLFKGDTRDVSDLAAFCLVYLSGFATAILIWMLLHTPSADKMVQWVRYRPKGWQGTSVARGLFDKGSPCWLAGLLLWVITICVVLAVNAYYFRGAVSVQALLAVAGVWLLFLLGYAGLFQAGLLTSRKSGTLVGILLLLMAILCPSLLAMMSESTAPLYVTPVGMCEHIEYLFEASSKIDTARAWQALVYSAIGGIVVLLVGQAWYITRLIDLAKNGPVISSVRECPGR